MYRLLLSCWNRIDFGILGFAFFNCMWYFTMTAWCTFYGVENTLAITFWLKTISCSGIVTALYPLAIWKAVNVPILQFSISCCNVITYHAKEMFVSLMPTWHNDFFWCANSLIIKVCSIYGYKRNIILVLYLPLLWIRCWANTWIVLLLYQLYSHLGVNTCRSNVKCHTLRRCNFVKVDVRYYLKMIIISHLHCIQNK